jgi:hypothetical protein
MNTTELLAERERIEADPANRSAPGSLWIYTAAARRKLDRINLAIAANMAADRAAAGRPVPTSGYSGRNSNRR